MAAARRRCCMCTCSAAPLALEELQLALPACLGLRVVEDAASALGAPSAAALRRVRRPRLLLVPPRKIVTTGEGGAVTTDDAALATRARPAPSRHRGRRRSTPRAGSTIGYPTSCALGRSPAGSAGDPPRRAGAAGRAGTRSAGARAVRRADEATARPEWQATSCCSRPPGRGADGATRAGHRVADRHLRGAPPSPTATGAPSRAPTRPSSARSRCPSRRR